MQMVLKTAILKLSPKNQLSDDCATTTVQATAQTFFINCKVCNNIIMIPAALVLFPVLLSDEA